MTHQMMEHPQPQRGYHDIVAADERHRSVARQLITGVGGMLALLVIGLVVLAVVLWKAP